MERYIELVLSRRWLVAVLATLIMLAIASGARFVTVSNDYRTLFSEEDPKLAALDALENTYSTSELALIAVTPQDGTVFTRETLGAIEALTDAAWQTPYSNRVDSLTNYSHSEASEDDLVVAPLVKNASSLSDAGLERVEKIALGAPAIAGRLVSHDGRVGGVAIKFILPENMDQAVAEITDYLQDMLQQARASHPQLSYHLTGSVVMHRAFSDATKNDLRTLTPFVFLVIVAVTIVLLRSVLGTLSIVAMILFVVNSTMGFAGWLNTT
ncbi:MAG: MMPL family transporter, partial [Gammaproteobacteria bacterium]|nr:MMPL family transporter [Gammaproteobacteria bacterium]